jgi:hypothetical protein
LEYIFLLGIALNLGGLFIIILLITPQKFNKVKSNGNWRLIEEKLISSGR